MKDARKTCSRRLKNATAVILLTAGMAFLVGCQGVSAGGKITPPSSGVLSSAPASFDFGSVIVGNTQSLSGTVTNTGASSITVSQVSINGTGFTISGISAPLTLAAQQSANFSVQFTPASAGVSSGTITVSSDATDATFTMAVSGTGTNALGTLSSSPSSLAFGSILVGQNQTLSETITNTGGSNVTISQVGITGTGFTLSGISTPLTVPAGQSATFNVAFAPLSAGNSSGSVTITSDASDPTVTVALSGTGTSIASAGTLSPNPSSLNFGSLTVGQNKTLSETITNIGGSSVTISQVATSGAGFTSSGITVPLTLTAGQSTSFSVKFAPGTSGSASGNVTITSDASNPTLTIPLSGTGNAAVGQLSISPATLALGSVVEGTSGSASGNLNASGANVTVTAASTNNSQFTVSGLSLPVTVKAGQSVPFTITFSPNATGAMSATLTVTSNAQPSTSTEALTGTGTAAPKHSVSLSWNASSSSNISGYNVYRAL